MIADSFLADHAEGWQELLRDLIRIRSVFEHEHAVVDRVAGCIEALGLPVHRIAHARDRLARLPHAQRPFSDIEGRCSLATRVTGSGGGCSIVLSAHLDIVPEGEREAWSLDPFAADLDPRHGLVYGRGAMDDKAGVAISLGVLEALVRMPVRLRGDVVFHYVLENETTGNGSLLCLADGHIGDAVAIIDGTRLDRLINEHAGQLQFEIGVRGRPAPVVVSHLGCNAAELMARLVLALRDAVHALNDTRTPPWTRFPSPFQLCVQRIHSEGTQLTVPDRADAQCYVTFAPPFALSDMRDLIVRTVGAFESAFGPEAPPSPVTLAWSGLAVEPTRADGRVLEAVVLAAARRVGLADVVPGPSTGTSDLRHFVRAGIPGLLFGPGNGHNPHRPDEHYAVDDLLTMIAIYLEILRSWCGTADAA